jgi:hypothetical protein
MKKVLTTLSIIVALNCSGQDTTYVQHHHKLFAITKTLVTDSIIYKQHYRVMTRRQKRNNVLFSVSAGIVFFGIVFLSATK